MLHNGPLLLNQGQGYREVKLNQHVPRHRGISYLSNSSVVRTRDELLQVGQTICHGVREHQLSLNESLASLLASHLKILHQLLPVVCVPHTNKPRLDVMLVRLNIPTWCGDFSQALEQFCAAAIPDALYWPSQSELDLSIPSEHIMSSSSIQYHLLRALYDDWFTSLPC